MSGAPEGPDDPETKFSVRLGDVVEVHGLSGATHHNGQIGHVSMYPRGEGATAAEVYYGEMLLSSLSPFSKLDRIRARIVLRSSTNPCLMNIGLENISVDALWPEEF
jgi:hypothetical protein